MSDLNLKNCPFCGEEAEHIHVYDGEETIRCSNSICFVRPGVSAELPIEAAESWNKRAEHDAHDVRIDALEEAAEMIESFKTDHPMTKGFVAWKIRKLKEHG